jgi:hypothetical protein
VPGTVPGTYGGRLVRMIGSIIRNRRKANRA